MLSDAVERNRVLTELDKTLLVEAAAGTGKASLIAGRVVMLMLHGAPMLFDWLVTGHVICDKPGRRGAWPEIRSKAWQDALIGQRRGASATRFPSIPTR
jgi:hypothetical protein